MNFITKDNKVQDTPEVELCYKEAQKPTKAHKQKTTKANNNSTSPNYTISNCRRLAELLQATLYTTSLTSLIGSLHEPLNILELRCI